MERRRPPKNNPTNFPPRHNNEAEYELSKTVERLQRDLTRRDRELEEERGESGRALERVQKLEKERLELKRELEDVRDEASEYQRLVEELQEEREATVEQRGQKRKGEELSEGDREDQEDLIRDLQYEVNDKNREIGQLVEDLEKFEDEKVLLKNKLSDLSESLQDATVQLETMARDSFDLKSKLEKVDEKVRQLEEEKTVLEIRERELLAFKERHDQYLENLCNAVDVRVDVWKKMMFQKDEEIDRLNTKIGALVTQIPAPQIDSEKTTVQQLKRKLKEREEQISLLTEKLYQATEELNTNTKALEASQAQVQRSEGGEETERLLRTFEKKVRKRDAHIEQLSESLRSCEQEAEEKAREVVDILASLQRYEAGEYGLPQAVAEIKELKTQIRLRNTQIESLTQDVNRHHLDQTELLEENEMLRGKLGLNYQTDLGKDRKAFVQNKRNEIEALRVKVELLENEGIHLKTKNYNLRKELAAQQQQTAPPVSQYVPVDQRLSERPPQHPQHNLKNQYNKEPPVSNTMVEEWKGKYEIILNENTELRKGFQEILESIHRLSEDGASTVKLESPILENLLREMSARGLINYPYAISSFHLKVCNLEGKNSELREELHRIRKEEKQLRSELIEAKATVKILEDRLRNIPSSTSPIRSKSPVRDSRPKSESKERSPKKVPKDNEETTVVTALVERHNLVIDDLQKEITMLKDENNNMRSTCNTEKSTLETRLRVLVEKGNDLFSGKSLGDNEKTRRKFSYLKVLRDQQVAEIESLHKKVADVENESLSKIAFLERFKAKALHQIATFQHILESSVPISLLYSTKKQVLDLTNRYQDLHMKNEKLSLEFLRKEKSNLDALELKELNRKLECELDKCQSQLMSLTSVSTVSSQSSKDSSVNVQPEVEELTKQVTRLTNLLKASEAEARFASDYRARVEELTLQASLWEQREKELKFQLSDSVPRLEHDQVAEKLLGTEERVVLSQDETLKWKEMAEVLQNQVNALHTIKHFERMEVESLVSQVCDLQAADLSKSEVARVKQELVASEKEKHLAFQQVQKLTSKLGQVEGTQLQQDKTYLDREMTLISNHAQVITRYRSLFSALHEFSTVPSSRHYSSAKDVAEAWELLKSCEVKAERLERDLDNEKALVAEYREKAGSLEEILTTLRAGQESQLNFEYAQRVQESRVEVSRWKRRVEQLEREVVALQANLHRAECYAAELDEDRIRLEHSMELKDSLAATFLTSDKITSGIIPVHKTASATALNKLVEVQVLIEKATKGVQTDEEVKKLTEVNYEDLLSDITEFKMKILELENLLRAKDQVINNFSVVSVEPVRPTKSEASYELEESLQVARETMASLNSRLKAKDDNLNQYKKLLADVRAEMTSGTERHVQEMKALQITIFQQQQAFTRMKSTLSHPVKDNSSIDSTIKDQLTRINELEDEVSELQHALGNVASQLTAARSDAHRWRTTADTRIKELDLLREELQSSSINEELDTLRQKVRAQQERIVELQTKSKELSATAGMNPPDPNPVTVMMHLLEEKDRQLEVFAKSATDTKSSQKLNERIQIEERLDAREKEIEALRNTNLDLQHKLSALQVKVSKLNALNQKSGVSAELEELRSKCKVAEQLKDSLQKRLDDVEHTAQAEEEKKRKTIDGFARWEEGKKWKKTVEKLESRIKELEEEATRLNKTMESLRGIILRLEKEKALVEARGKVTKSGKSGKDNEASTIDLGLVEKLRIEVTDLNELVERTEFEGREEVEKLKMEVRILKERIVSQERQLTAYQVAQKGNPQIIQEIEKMAASEDSMQKEIIRLEEENLHLKLQIEQLRLDTPRLRDRVQHLQKLVEVLKIEKPSNLGKIVGTSTTQSSSQRSLGELERTISALKSVIEKLQTENKRLKIKPGAPASKQSTSSEKLKATLGNLMDEKKELLDQIHNLERERSKLSKMYAEGSSRVESIESKLSDAEQRAKSAEMKLKTFLGKTNETGASGLEEGVRDKFEANALVYKQIRMLKEELERKDKLLTEAKLALQEAAASKKVDSKK